MKKKLLLFMAMIVACGVILTPKAAMADVTSTAKTFTVTVPVGAAWDLTPTGNSFTITSQNFDWEGGGGFVDIPAITFGDPTTPVSYLITNDVGTVQDYNVTLTIASGANTTATFSDVDTINLDSTSVTSTVDVGITNIGATGPAEIGGLAFGAIDANNLDISAALGVGSMAEVGATNKFGVELQLDIDQTTLTEDDAPCSLIFNLTFTVANVL